MLSKGSDFFSIMFSNAVSTCSFISKICIDLAGHSISNPCLQIDTISKIFRNQKNRKSFLSISLIRISWPGHINVDPRESKVAKFRNPDTFSLNQLFIYILSNSLPNNFLVIVDRFIFYLRISLAFCNLHSLAFILIRSLALMRLIPRLRFYFFCCKCRLCIFVAW